MKSVEMPSASMREPTVGSLPRPAVRAAAIGRGDHADGARVLRRPREAGHDVRQVMRRDNDVAVVDEDVGISRVRQHLHEVRDLAVRAEQLRAFDDADRVIREFLLKLVDGNERGVGERADAEEDLVLACILLHAVAGECRVHLVIEAADRLEDADRRREGGVLAAEAVHEGARAPQGEEVVADARPGEDRGDGGNDGGVRIGVQVLGTGCPGDCACGAFCEIASYGRSAGSCWLPDFIPHLFET